MNGPREGSEPETTSRPGQAASATGGPGEKAGPARPTARILILEDDPWDAELAQRLLTGAGLGLHRRRRRHQGVVRRTAGGLPAQTSSCPISICPASPARWPSRSLRNDARSIPFIIWSGVLGDEAAVGLIKQGATDYILKDRPARLASAIQRALAEAEQRAYLAQLEDQLVRCAAPGQPRPAGRRRRGREPHPPEARRRPPAGGSRRFSAVTTSPGTTPPGRRAPGT